MVATVARVAAFCTRAWWCRSPPPIGWGPSYPHKGARTSGRTRWSSRSRHRAGAEVVHRVAREAGAAPPPMAAAARSPPSQHSACCCRSHRRPVLEPRGRGHAIRARRAVQRRASRCEWSGSWSSPSAAGTDESSPSGPSDARPAVAAGDRAEVVGAAARQAAEVRANGTATKPAPTDRNGVVAVF